MAGFWSITIVFGFITTASDCDTDRFLLHRIQQGGITATVICVIVWITH